MRRYPQRDDLPIELDRPGRNLTPGLMLEGEVSTGNRRQPRHVLQHQRHLIRRAAANLNRVQVVRYHPPLVRLQPDVSGGSVDDGRQTFGLRGARLDGLEGRLVDRPHLRLVPGKPHGVAEEGLDAFLWSHG